MRFLEKPFSYLWIFCFFNNYSYSNNIFTVAIPKSGTYLLIKCITLLTDKKKINFNPNAEHSIEGLELLKLKNNVFYSSHLPYVNGYEKLIFEKFNKVIFIYRDPRDNVISLVSMILNCKEIYKKDIYWQNKTQNDFSKNKLIDVIIDDIREVYNLFIPWKNFKNICSVQFENLVGPKGKGDALLQKNEIIKICEYLNIDPKDKLEFCIKNLFGNSQSFNDGLIGKWKENFSEKQKEKFKRIAGKLLIELGYEKDLNW